MSRKVMLRFRLVGRSYKQIEIDNEKLEVYMAECDIKNQFGDRPVFVATGVKDKYPKMYAVGWATSNKLIDSTDGWSELLVVAHGNTMESANKNMVKALTSIDWEKNARNL